MNHFEREIDKTLQGYRDQKVAHVKFMHPPMRVAGMMGRAPCFVQAGKAPYDLVGFFYDRCATSIGVELKETRDHEHSIRIVGAEKKGDGLQEHQLAGLVDLHNAGGYAALVWSNGGEVGRIGGDMLAVAKLAFDMAQKVEKAGKDPAKGAKSILWGLFDLVKNGHDNRPIWLPKSPFICNRKG